MLAFAAKVEIVADESLLEILPGLLPGRGRGRGRRQSFAASASPRRSAIPQRPLDDAQLRKRRSACSSRLAMPRSAPRLVELGLGGLQDKSACKALADTMWDACAI